MAARWCCLPVLLLAITLSAADGPGDNKPDNVRPVPPPGVELPAGDRDELQAGVAELGKEIEGLRKALAAKPALLDLLPDVQVYHNAVRYALKYNEFYNKKDVKSEVKTAHELLRQGHDRARQLRSDPVKFCC